ncbi:hypothetical protein PAXRUDRAFT_623067 [Paxillus rubicundulus Ve08.2h10]|uniref:Unplaced genomic scaffold scaffold_55, whole genome shotgun sequence n=1 Tax=Paxillus rubicundulus Ve08.2h10 TaxID=930991 RepID=A0A0D0E8W4_9AGAM|nr:hypothetical protein PAXRUDRAFT_623067 [Paxillus rubicundulus Ve08.2h10]
MYQRPSLRLPDGLQQIRLDCIMTSNSRNPLTIPPSSARAAAAPLAPLVGRCVISTERSTPSSSFSSSPLRRASRFSLLKFTSWS